MGTDPGCLMSWTGSQSYMIPMFQVLVLSDKRLSRYGLLENFGAEMTNWKTHAKQRSKINSTSSRCAACKLNTVERSDPINSDTSSSSSSSSLYVTGIISERCRLCKTVTSQLTQQSSEKNVFKTHSGRGWIKSLVGLACRPSRNTPRDSAAVTQ